MNESESVSTRTIVAQAPDEIDWKTHIIRAGVLLTSILVTRSGMLAAAYHGLNRLAYILFITLTLSQQTRLKRASMLALQHERDFRACRKCASLLMEADAVSFVGLVWSNAMTLPHAIPDMVTLLLGSSLTLVGIGCKYWAARSLGRSSYYWHDFFAPSRYRGATVSGPYRFLENPMYTIGYAHAYGISLLFRSWPGLVASMFDQVMILAFYYAVERPHVMELYGPGPDPGPKT